MLNEISFEAGSLETMIERLFKTMNSIDKQWSEKVEPASQKQIHALEEIADLKQHGKSISNGIPESGRYTVFISD